jgi:hypothetical protein
MKRKNPLLGKTIKEVWLASDKMAIKFVCDESIIAKVDADCCSHTWIESLDDPEALLGTVREVEDLTLKVEEVDYETIQFYGLKITTEKGRCVIDYRNESNGYYGGNISWPGDHFYGGVYGQNVSTEEWKQVA